MINNKIIRKRRNLVRKGASYMNDEEYQEDGMKVQGWLCNIPVTITFDDTYTVDHDTETAQKTSVFDYEMMVQVADGDTNEDIVSKIQEHINNMFNMESKLMTNYKSFMELTYRPRALRKYPNAESLQTITAEVDISDVIESL